MQPAGSRGPSPAVVLGIVAGVLMAVGSFLTWATLKIDLGSAGLGSQSFAAKGFDGLEGKIGLGCGIVIAVAALVLTARAEARVGASVLMILGGLLAGGFALYDAMTARQQAIDAATDSLAKSTGLPAAQVRSQLERLFDQGVLRVSLSIGIFIVIAAGALAVIAAILAVTRRGEPELAAAPLEPGSMIAVGADMGFAATAQPVVPPPPPVAPPQQPTTQGPSTQQLPTQQEPVAPKTQPMGDDGEAEPPAGP